MHFSGRRLFAYDMEKTELHSVMKWQFLTESFFPLHTLLFWFRTEVVDARFILNNELWNKFLLGHVGIVREVLQKLVNSSGVSILDTLLTDTLFIRWNAQNIYSPKSHIMIMYVAFWALVLLRSKYYFNFILVWTELGRAENFLIAPRTTRLLYRLSRLLFCVLKCQWKYM